MIRRRLIRVVVLGLGFCAAAGVTPARAQDDRGLELGGQLTTLRLSEFDTTDVGGGIHAGWRLGTVFVLDGALNWFPGGDDDEGPRVEGQRRVLGVAGVRAGVQSGRIELFGRARPGFLRFSEKENVPCIAIFPTPLECQVLSGQTSFVTELGGGVRIQLDAGGRMYLSFDISDLLVRYGSEALRPSGEATEDGFVSHNLLAGVGLGWTF
jgi:hypothetical protein